MERERERQAPSSSPQGGEERKKDTSFPPLFGRWLGKGFLSCLSPCIIIFYIFLLLSPSLGEVEGIFPCLILNPLIYENSKF